MKRAICLLLFLSTCFVTNAQNYDLVVKSNGDSIACKIDSVTDQTIYLEMISNNRWVKTGIARSNVKEYKYNVIDRKSYIFRPGTSYIDKASVLTSVRDIRRNAVSFESNIVFSSMNYGRLLPLKDNVGLTVGAGINYFAWYDFGDFFYTLESTLLVGRTKHFFEPGLELALEDSELYIYLGAGYRYQGFKGLLLKAHLGFCVYGDGNAFMPMLSLGYAF